MFSADTIDNVFAGNYIGVDATGAGPLGNGDDGMFIGAATNSNRIGTDGDGIRDAAEGNVIAFNAEDGIKMRDLGTVGNSIRGNSIHSNGELGIDLNPNGSDDEVTPNDLGDTDVGANNLQNFPEIKNAVSLPLERTLVVGTVNAAANATLTLDFYANATVDPSGHGEGQRWLGSLVVTTDEAGLADFTFILSAASTGGELVTATATASDGSTSEFSRALTIKQSTSNSGESASGLVRRAWRSSNAPPRLTDEPASRSTQRAAPVVGSPHTHPSHGGVFLTLVFDFPEESNSREARLSTEYTDWVFSDLDALAPFWRTGRYVSQQ
jgi:hypothetical protein